MNTTNQHSSPDLTSRPEQIENTIQILVLLAVGGMAGAASFTHMHDWTMANSPAHTPAWFGWGNAVISELTPLIAGLEIRRRRRNGEPVGLALVVLVAFAGLSLAAQFAQAKPGISGWLLAGLPAMAFMILIKLVLSRSPISARVSSPAEVEAPAAVRVSTPAEVPVSTRAEVAAPAEVRPSSWAEAERKPPAPRAEIPLTPHPTAQAPDTEEPQLSPTFPPPVPVTVEQNLPAEIPTPTERKPDHDPTVLLPAERTPETTWAAVEALLAEDPTLTWKAIAERIGVTDRRLRQIRAEMTTSAPA